MKKGDIISLIRAHFERNEVAFQEKVNEIARYFDSIGDSELAQYIMGLMANNNTMSPQVFKETPVVYMKKDTVKTEALPLPSCISEDIIGLVNAIKRNMGIHKVLFQGPPGTGKTESVKQVARILKRELRIIDMAELVDSRLGQTGKNIQQLFDDLNKMARTDDIVVLFDEIDSIVLNRVGDNDVREMGRAMSLFLKELENLNESVLLIGTTNLFKQFDKALVRRFDAIIDFDRYTEEDLLEIAEKMLTYYQEKDPNLVKNKRLFNKIIKLLSPLPYPGDLKNLIKTSIAFSSLKDGNDYMRRLYTAVTNKRLDDIEFMREQKFSLREIELLSGTSIAQLSRYFKQET